MNIYRLSEIPEDKLEEVGGKARGLKLLTDCGLKIPDGFVIIGIDNELDLQAAADYYEKSGLKKVAVRSSASGEDSADFSSAGQYDTYLNLEGKAAVKKGISDCLASLDNPNIDAYTEFFNSAKSFSMCVIVQEMVNASAAGVCFTQMQGDEDTIMIEAVAGLGDKLVDGSVQAHSYRISKKDFDPKGDDLISDKNLSFLAVKAKHASDALGYPLDMEWAMVDGELYWLQARPITANELLTPFELDSEPMSDTHIYTTCNVGEMLPGAVTPLSISTSVRALDHGMRRMLVETGTTKNLDKTPPGSGVSNFGNHLFINLTEASKMGDHIVGANRSSVEMSICGRTVTEPDDDSNEVNLAERLNNARKYFSIILGRKDAVNRIDALARSFDVELWDHPFTQIEEISKKMNAMEEAFWYHYVASSNSGAMSSAVYSILLDKGIDPDEAKKLQAGCLADIDDIESVDILRSLRAVAREMILENPRIVNSDVTGVKEAMQNGGPEMRKVLDAFMRRHGHRAIREAEIRSKSWHMDDDSLASFLKTIIATDVRDPKKEEMYDDYIKEIEKHFEGKLGGTMKYIIENARKGVVAREYTKSQSIKVLDKFKVAYRFLGDTMVNRKLLPDADLVFFFTHEELVEYINHDDKALVKRAIARRRLFEQQKRFKFNEINIGRPQPIEEVYEVSADKVMTGSSISRGTATGKARVVTSVEDANQLEKGEIMVASFTDIGWSPYYCTINALVTEIGSALSHGAVVAREYALPLVSNVSNATRRIQTGDLLMVDANTGEVKIIS
ncbi:MAG: PEP/pyruvate-binding domain-containing protein [Eubacteriales bacterium]